MDIYTPTFNRIRNLLEKLILKYIGFNIEVSFNDINEHIMKLKEENKNSVLDYELIDFTFNYPYSSQIQDLIVDLVRRCVVDQTSEGYRLSSLGKKYLRDLT